MARVIFSLFLFMATLVGFAQSPQAISYQAVARNANGLILPVTNINVRFSILEGSLTGNAIYQETQAATTNIFGLFVLSIGKGTVISGSFETIDWAASEKFLKVEVAPNGDNNYSVQGTTQLLSVPYALYAEKTKLVAGNGISITNGNTISATASTAWQSDANGINYSTGNVGIGVTSSQSTALSIKQANTNGASSALDIAGDDTWQTVVRFRNTNFSGREYQLQYAGPNNVDIAPRAFALYQGTSNLSNPAFVFNTDGTDKAFLAIGSYNYKAQTPKSRLHVFNGDVNIEDIGSGIIMKSPNGQCWRVTVSDTGALVTTAIACPN